MCIECILIGREIAGTVARNELKHIKVARPNNLIEAIVIGLLIAFTSYMIYDIMIEVLGELLK